MPAGICACQPSHGVSARGAPRMQKSLALTCRGPRFVPQVPCCACLESIDAWRVPRSLFEEGNYQRLSPRQEAIRARTACACRSQRLVR